MNRSILLDTCAAIWIAQGVPIARDAEEAITRVKDAGGTIAISPISAWEVGLLVSRGRLALSRDPGGWFDDLLETGFDLAPLTPGMLVSSSFLPGPRLRDPADRIIVASARTLNYRLMTRDASLLDFAAAGHLSAVAC
ncbi:MAG: type II toxin-antitoxin system VapC family toxin [Caulobacteraceae bacterium]